MSLHVDIQKFWKNFSLRVQFSCESDETTGILGASGSGKSMILRSISGLITPDKGHIELDGRTLFHAAKRINLPPRKRNIGYLFQNYALFPHMSVHDNLLCACKCSRQKATAETEALLKRFDLLSLSKRYPAQLSGGQQQRVALARAIATRPNLLLLDEPFSALDTHLKEGLLLDMHRHLQSFPGPALLVTHSRDEIYKLCNQLLFLQNGQNIGFGNTKHLFSHPQTLEAARLTGCKNFSRAKTTTKGFVHALDWGVDLPVIEPLPQGFTHIGVRAHHFIACEASDIGAIPVQLIEEMDAPFETDFLFQSCKAPPASPCILWFKCGKHHPAQPLPTHLRVDPKQVLLLRKDIKE